MDFPSLTLGFLWEGVGGGVSFRKRFIVGFSLLFVIFSSFCCGYQSEVDELPAGLEIATGEFCRRILRNDNGGILGDSVATEVKRALTMMEVFDAPRWSLKVVSFLRA